MLEQCISAITSALRALPVLRGKGVERQELDLQIAAAFDDRAPIPRLLVAFDPRQPALLRPAPVAIHDDGDVARNGIERLWIIMLRHDGLAALRADAGDRQLRARSAPRCACR